MVEVCIFEFWVVGLVIEIKCSTPTDWKTGCQCRTFQTKYILNKNEMNANASQCLLCSNWSQTPGFGPHLQFSFIILYNKFSPTFPSDEDQNLNGWSLTAVLNISILARSSKLILPYNNSTLVDMQVEHRAICLRHCWFFHNKVSFLGNLYWWCYWPCLLLQFAYLFAQK